MSAEDNPFEKFSSGPKEDEIVVPKFKDDSYEPPACPEDGEQPSDEFAGTTAKERRAAKRAGLQKKKDEYTLLSLNRNDDRAPDAPKAQNAKDRRAAKRAAVARKTDSDASRPDAGDRVTNAADVQAALSDAQGRCGHCVSCGNFRTRALDGRGASYVDLHGALHMPGKSREPAPGNCGRGGRSRRVASLVTCAK